ncbi:MAG TPA: membrane protein insertion efficiency factor YidD [Verrucomicrobiae bacterium]
MNPAQFILIFAVRCYRTLVSPLLSALFSPLGIGCRFSPTCSAYAMESLSRHGAAKGSLLALRRVCRCHPFGGSGYDPTPTGHLLWREALTGKRPMAQSDCACVAGKLEGVQH